jgi:hypothetical protein
VTGEPSENERESSECKENERVVHPRKLRVVS